MKAAAIFRMIRRSRTLIARALRVRVVTGRTAATAEEIVVAAADARVVAVVAGAAAGVAVAAEAAVDVTVAAAMEDMAADGTKS